MNSEEQPSRFSRWSSRKLAKGHESDEKPRKERAQDLKTDEQQEAQQAALEAELEANRLAAEAVDIDALDKESDLSAFFKAGVPQLLKNRAMMAMWRTDPVFANVDGLVEYGHDYANPDMVMKTFKSAYEIGKGYFFAEREEAIAQSADAGSSQADMVLAECETDVGVSTHETALDSVETDEQSDAFLPEATINRVAEEPLNQPPEPEPATPNRVSLRKRLLLEN